MSRSPSLLNPRRQRGVALLLVLSCITVLSILLIGFVSQMGLSRATSMNYASGIGADQMAVNAAENITAELLAEIRAGSINGGSVTNGVTIYMPMQSGGRYDSSLPARLGFSASDLASLDAADKLKLRRRSSATATYSALYDADHLFLQPASAAGTDKKSINGKWISASRWRKSNLAPSADFSKIPPDWIYLSRTGPMSVANSNLNSSAPTSANNPVSSNPQYIVGRYAYYVYDIGGLLDINVAGNLLSTTSNLSHGRFHQISPASLPGVASPSALSQFINWRWPVSASNSSRIERSNGLFDAARDFRSPLNGENLLMTRQDLLRVSQSSPNWFSSGTTPFLTVFSREVNKPSWFPNPSRARVAAANGAISSRVGKDDATNPNLNLQVNSDSTPKLSSRFPLQRLDLFLDPVGNAADIEKYFGLTNYSASTRQWTYRSGQSAILTPDQISEREPDFFELLQAAILTGSIGKTSVAPADGSALTTGNSNTLVFNGKNDTTLSYQIMQIGANLLDQADTDNYPTSILFGNGTGVRKEIYGIENLPYLSEMFYLPHRDSTQPDQVHFWWLFEVWNPHQNAASSPAWRFRILADKGVNIPCVRYGTTMVKGGGVTYSTTVSSIDFLNSSASQEPQLIIHPSLPAGSGLPIVNQSSALNKYDDQWASLPPTASPSVSSQSARLYVAGIYGGYVGFVPDIRLTPAASDANTYSSCLPVASADSAGEYPQFTLQYSEDGTNFHTYQRLDPLNIAGGGGIVQGDIDCFINYYGVDSAGNSNKRPTSPLPPVYQASFKRPDPRSNRFGWMASSHPNTPYTDLISPNRTDWQTANPNTAFFVSNGSGNNWAGWNYNGTSDLKNNPFPWPLIADNSSSGVLKYTDPDGVIRPGDACSSKNVQPMIPSATLSRPILLNRPFQSVAEMGYAFRDVPWKTLDLGSTSSADAALLDVFSLDGSSNTLSTPIVAGRVNLNAAPVEVIQALLDNTGRRVADPSQLLTTTIAQTIRNEINNNGPLLNRAEIATRLIPAVLQAYPSDSYIYQKSERESIARALADVTSTRTWNLFYDIIAQSGRFSGIAKTPDDFEVFGERHIWVHIAIDRYTGEVVSRMIETVYE